MEIHSRDHSALDAAIEAARRLEATLAELLAPAHGAPDDRDWLLAAEKAYASGRLEQARQLLARVAVDQCPPGVRARIHQLHAWLDATAGRPLHAHERLLTEAAALEASEPLLAADLLADAALAAAVAGESVEGVAAARRARDVAAPEVTAAVELRAGIALLLAGDAAGEELIRGALARAGEEELSSVIFRLDTTALYWTENYDAAAAVLDRLIEHGRRSRDPLLSGWLDTRAAIDFRLGLWAAAEARAAEARRLAEALGQPMQTASCLTTMARISAACGRAAECRRRLAEAAALSGAGEGLQFGWERSAAGLLELGLGRVAEASEILEPLVRSSVGQSALDPAVALGTSDLIESYVRAGRADDARAVCEAFEPRALASGRSWAVAALHRSRGLLAPPAEIDFEFAEALRHHRRTATPFELARTELCYGERLRRARRRRDARTHLSSALGTFEQLGAVPWAERGRRELAATQSRERTDGGSVERLTPHELRVASLVEQGLRNREVAAALFVSERTVEYHLTNIYGKLGVRSRTELTRRLGQAAASAPSLSFR